jgi:hypothetical protein
MLQKEGERPRHVVRGLLRLPRKEGLVTTVNLLREPLQHAYVPTAGAGGNGHRRDDLPTFASAVSAALDGVRAGTVSATAPEDRWLVGRIEEALAGVDDIQQMAGGGRRGTSPGTGGTHGTASILARRAQLPA